jgi:2-phospho-L-lactate guanylyltransferase
MTARNRSSRTSLRPLAIIPIKRFERGKTRLRSELAESARSDLVRRMFEHVLDAALSCPELHGTLVATDGPEVAELAASRGARVLLDPVAGPLGLADVVDAALAHARALGADSALVLMADLPRIEARDVSALAAALEAHDVVLAPDARGEHTNALALRLDRGLRSAFGDPASLKLHEARARALGLRVQRLDNPRLAFDVDLPGDLDAVARMGPDW